MCRRILMIVLTGVLAGQALGEGGKTKLLVELGLDAQFATPPIKEVSNVFESIRNVPIHKDDWGSPGAIAKDKARAPWMTEIRFFKIGTETDLNSTTVWRNYFDLSWNFGHWALWGADVRERNYTNAVGTDKQGYGAALTFWAPGYSRLIPGFKTEFHFNDDWFLGAGFRKYDLEIITGYDRYDKLEHESHVDIGKIFETSLFLGWIGSVDDQSRSDFRIGVNFNSFDKKDRYNAIDVDVNEVSFFAAFSLIWKF